MQLIIIINNMNRFWTNIRNLLIFKQNKNYPSSTTRIIFGAIGWLFLLLITSSVLNTLYKLLN